MAETEQAAAHLARAEAGEPSETRQMMEADRLDALHRILQRQQAQIDALREESEALCECVLGSGFVSRQTLLAQVHRLRFEKMRRKHPLASDGTASLGFMLGAHELALGVARSSDLRSLRALHAASKGISGAASLAMPLADLRPLGEAAGNVFVCGGYDGARFLNLVDRYDPAAGSWRPVPPMASVREAAAAAVLGGFLYVAGGFDGQRKLEAAERFDLRGGTWEQLPAMTVRRVHSTAAAFGGKLYVCAGFDGESYLNSAECFDPARSIWEPLPPMSVGREGSASCILKEHLYVCGGNDGAQTLNVVERITVARALEPGGVVWETMPPMLTRRDGAIAAGIRGRLFVCGGFDGEHSLSLRSAERFDPTVGSWRVLRDMISRRAGAASAVVAGKLYVCGGYDGAQNLAECERLDPVVGMWELLPPMPTRRGYSAGAAS